MVKLNDNVLFVCQDGLGLVIIHCLLILFVWPLSRLQIFNCLYTIFVKIIVTYPLYKFSYLFI